MAQMWTAPDAGPFQRVMALIVLAGLTAGSLYLGAWVLDEHQTAEASENWPQVEGRLVDGSEVVHYRTGKNVLASLMSAYSELEVSYTYKVKGKTYTGTTAAFEKPVDAGAFVKEHAVGDLVPVYYNPGNNSEAVLFPGRDQSHFFLYGGVCAFMSGALALTLINAISGWIKYDSQNAAAKPVKKRKKKIKKKV